MSDGPSARGLFEFRPELAPTRISAAELSALTRGRDDSRVDLEGVMRAFLDQARIGVLLILQGLNASGKDGVVAAIADRLGAAAFVVHHFKRPNDDPSLEDMLDDSKLRIPRPGQLVIFNRSYYEPILRAAAQAPRHVDPLFSRIIEHERLLSSSKVSVVKLFLHIDRAEQLRRLEARQTDPLLRPLHNPRDLDDQTQWDGLLDAYGRTMEGTHTRSQPWLVIPSNDRSTRNAVISEVLADVLVAEPRSSAPD